MTVGNKGTIPAEPGRSPVEKVLDRGFIGLAIAAAMATGGLLLAIVGVILVAAWPAMQTLGLAFLWTSTWNPVAGREAYGALPMIIGTLVSAAIALLLAVPLGVGTAIFLSEDFLPRPLCIVMGFLVELLAAIPSVVYGLWGIFVLIPITQRLGIWLNTHFGQIPLFSTAPVGPGMLPAGIVLAVMVLPIITVVSRDSLAALPPELRQAAFSLGATRWNALFGVLIPAAFSGIVGSVMLALGRALGETMAVTMLIGNSNQLSPSLLAPANTIASLLANQFAEAQGLQVSALMYAALVLVAMTLGVNALAEVVVAQVRGRYG